MNRIEKLIAELCPEGVEWKALGDVAELVRGNGMPKTDLTDSGVGAIHYGQIYTRYGVWTESTLSFVSPEKAARLSKASSGDIIITNTSENMEDVCKAVAWLGSEQIVTGGHATIIKHHENPKYLSYWFRTESFFLQKKKLAQGTKVIDVSAKNLAKVLIPLPPLAIQQEIVDILGTFTSLEAELEAELEARKTQYEFYRNSLLTFEKGVPHFSQKVEALIQEFCPKGIEWKALGDVCNYADYRGKTPKKTDSGIFLVTAKNIRKGFIDYESSKEYVSEDEYPEIMRRGHPRIGDVLITTEAPCGNVAQIDREDIALAQRVIKYRAKDNTLNHGFLKFVLLSEKFQNDLSKVSTGSTVKGVRGSLLHKIKIPIPPIDAQQEIVAILDKFDALVNDISIGLPAEIAARRKQYEYYREKLLTFKRKEA